MSSSFVKLLLTPYALIAGGLLLVGCPTVSGGGFPGGQATDGGTGIGGTGEDDTAADESDESGLPSNTDGGGFTCMVGVAIPPGCGDGVQTEDEACDDGNTQGGDGCTADCLCVEPGYQCPIPGQPCYQAAICGDGLVVVPEPCDDGNNENGDGCSEFCKIELGWDCDGEPSECFETTCGDGVQEGAEACDDGNTMPFDGCSSTCQAEPDCSGSDGCSSECGDGLVIDEQCDDGNNTNGDGCSASCEIEAGFECEEDDSCEQINDECVLRVPAIFRDFNASHSDFEVNCDGLQTGAVQPMLDDAGKPVASGTPVCQGNGFAQWYTDSTDSATIVGDVVLFDNGDGSFVNRWGPEGERWTALENPEWAANNLEDCEAMGCVPCPWDPNVGCTADAVEYDGQPFFFPIDDHPDALDDTRHPARIGPAYGYPNWPYETDLVPGAGNHNFHFTTELVYWFQYDASVSAQLDFTGDDDVWVFVNGHLALDLGGVHVPLSGVVTIDPTTEATYGLTDGNVYPISVFHAERRLDGSSFRLTLAGFSNTPSNCLAICGDGIVGLGEQCDDGVNDGGYGECGEGCVLGEYCGDGIVQEEEDCDDGNYVNDDGCPNGCVMINIP